MSPEPWFGRRARECASTSRDSATRGADPSPCHPIILSVPRWAARIGRGWIDLVYPPRCLVCEFPGPEAMCRECVEAIPRSKEPEPSVESGLDGIIAVGRHERVLREAIHQLKYGRRRALAAPLGKLLARRLESVLPEWWPEIVLPVPIHWWRRLQRGFNQSELLAAEVARLTELRAGPGTLVRIRHTRSQVGLSREERRRNVAGAFRVREPGEVHGRACLLLDDVWTSSSTLAECARVLREAGARAVYAAVLAHPAIEEGQSRRTSP